MIEREPSGTTWTLKSWRGKLLAIFARLNWLPPLLARITIGVVFVSTG